MRLPDRLPSLDGRLGAAVQRVYALVALIVVAITLASAWCGAIDTFRDEPATAHYGLTLSNDEIAGLPSSRARGGKLRE